PLPQAKLEAFLSSVPVGSDSDHGDYLRRAFQHLAQALSTADGTARAELMLLGNLEIAYFEQDRVQPEILDALEAPYTSTRQLGRLLLEAIAPGAAGWSSMFRTPLAFVVGAGGRVAEASLRALLRRLITESLITLSLPDGVLRLGRDLVGEPPECLREPVHPELRAMLERLSPATGDANGAGA